MAQSTINIVATVCFCALMICLYRPQQFIDLDAAKKLSSPADFGDTVNKSETWEYIDGCVGDGMQRDDVRTRDAHLRDFAENTRWFFHHWVDWTRGQQCRVPNAQNISFKLTRPEPHRRKRRKKTGRPSKTFNRRLRKMMKEMEWNVMNNVCLSSQGGVYGFGLVQPTRVAVRNEFKSTLHRFYVHPLKFVPKCVIETPLAIHLVTLYANNLGHATSRVLGHRRAIEHLGPAFSESNDTITAFLVAPDAHKHDIVKVNKFKPYVSLMSPQWLSLNTSEPSVLDPSSVVCFSTAAFALMSPIQWEEFPKRELFVMDPFNDALQQQAKQYAKNLFRTFHEDYTSLKMDTLRCMNAVPAVESAVRVTWIGRQKRAVANEEQLFNFLEQQYAYNTSIKFQFIRLEKLSFPEQARIIAATDVLMGAHGAGLTWVYLLRRGSVLVEFEPWLSTHFDNFLSCAPRGINSGPYCPFGHITATMGGVAHVVEHGRPVRGTIPNSNMTDISTDIAITRKQVTSAFASALDAVGKDISDFNTFVMTPLPQLFDRGALATIDNE